MQILYEKPPVWDRAITELGADRNTIFTYGDTIYVPSGIEPDAALLDHEFVHIAQQAIIGVDLWWDRYFQSPDFRLEQELPAYKTQYESYCRMVKDRNARARYLNYITHSITGNLYGHLSVIDIRKLILGR